MKKIIAIAMALVMMMAVAVPAFATDTLDAANATGDTIVIVDGKTEDIGDGTYSVTIPAAVNLNWGENGADEYMITSQLATGKRVKVELAKSVDLTSEAGNVIVFTATDATEGISDKEVVNEEKHTFNITVEPDAWVAVPYDRYEGQISFASSVVDAE